MHGVYLDYNATAPLRPEAEAAALAALRVGGNPSSVHALGRAARAMLESARGEVASLVGAREGSLTFTSGGTEANALAIESAIAAGAQRLLIGATEHPSIVETARMSGVPVEVWPVGSNGVACLDWLQDSLRRPGRSLAALSVANNETGVIQPAAEAARLVREAGGLIHLDAVQAAGKTALDFAALGADTLALSGHKLGAPQGVGALVAGPRAEIRRRLHGGGQERGRRAGTENLAGIAGFGAAALAARHDLISMAEQTCWRDLSETRLIEAAGVVVMGAGAPRLPTVLCFASEGFAAHSQVMALDLDGVMVSAGSACSSGKVAPSAVLTAMGQGGLAACAIRASGGWASTPQDWSLFVEVWLSAFARHAARVGARSASAA